MDGIEQESATRDTPHYFIGTSGWTYDHWKGRFYPHDLPKKRWFDFYTSQFSTVEVNATFYRTFKDDTFRNWKERSPQGFSYILKAPRLITHRKYLVDVEADIRSFYRSCALLEEKFELILLQVAPNMHVDLEVLQKALRAFPDPGKVAVEFRHPGWLNRGTLSLLTSVGATICNADSPQHKLTDCLTSDRAYLRLHGRHRWYASNYSDDELHEIADLAHDLANRGAKRIYIFFNNDYEGYATANARTLQRLLDAA